MKIGLQNYTNEILSYIHGHWHSIVGPTLTTKSFKNSKKKKVPVILLPGIFEKVEMLETLIAKISENGHPIFIVPNLGYNFKNIAEEVAQLTKMI